MYSGSVDAEFFILSYNKFSFVSGYIFAVNSHFYLSFD